MNTNEEGVLGVLAKPFVFEYDMEVSARLITLEKEERLAKEAYDKAKNALYLKQLKGPAYKCRNCGEVCVIAELPDNSCCHCGFDLRPPYVMEKIKVLGKKFSACRERHGQLLNCCRMAEVVSKAEGRPKRGTYRFWCFQYALMMGYV